MVQYTNMQKKMVKIILFSFLFLTFSFGASNIASAVNSCPTINGSQLFQCTGSGNCVTSLDLCPRVPSASGGSTSSSTTGARCSGALLTTPRGTTSTAAADCANLAEEQGRAQGYDVDCRVEEYQQVQVVPYSASTQSTLEAAGYTGITVNSSTTPPTLSVPTLDRQPRCTINGLDVFDARSLVGYSDPNSSGYVVPDAFFGLTRTYGSGYTLNPGWNSVACALADSAAGRSGSTSGLPNCGAGSRTTTRPGVTPPRTTTTTPPIPSCRYTATCGTTGGATSSTGGTATTSGTGIIRPSVSSRDAWYYRDPYVSDINGSGVVGPIDSSGCTGYESNPDCHPEWDRPGSLCGASSMSGACDPKRVNPYAAASVAQAAETTVRQRGYTTSCSARYTSYRPNIDSNTGLNYYYTTQCTLGGAVIMSTDAISSATSATWSQVDAQIRATEILSRTGGAEPFPTYLGGLDVGVDNTNCPPTCYQYDPIPTPPACRLTATCGTTTPPSNTPALFDRINGLPVTNTTVRPGVDPANMSFRFIKIETTEKGWVSWREIEVYDKNGVKLNLTTNKVYAPTFFVSGGQPSSASKAFDGNIETDWSAGESNESCRVPGVGCVGKERKAVFIVDLGDLKNIQRIKLIENGDILEETTIVLVSNNNKEYVKLAQFDGPMNDREELNLPVRSPYAVGPSIGATIVEKKLPGTLTQAEERVFRGEYWAQVNSLSGVTDGSYEITMTPKTSFDVFRYLWKIENADYIKITKTIERDASLGVVASDASESGGCATNQKYYDGAMFPNYYGETAGSVSELKTNIFLKPDFIMPKKLEGSLYPGNSGIFEPLGGSVNDCNVGKIYKTTITSYQNATGKTSKFDLTIKVKK